MAGDLRGHVAVVTGAASGIGEATARGFVAQGGAVVIADLQAEKGEALARELGRAAFLKTDVTREEDVAAAVQLAVDRFGRLDCMVNNAGVLGAIGSILEISAAHWHKTLAILLDSVFYGIKHAARVMVPQGGGCILSVASTAGVMGGLGPHAYAAAKHAVIGLTKSAASELSSHGVRVNAVAPGTTVTQLVTHLQGSIEEAVARAISMSPLQRPVMPEDIANALLFLAGETGRNLSAQVIVIDGGFTGAGMSGPLGPAHHRQPAAFVAATPQNEQDS